MSGANLRFQRANPTAVAVFNGRRRALMLHAVGLATVEQLRQRQLYYGACREAPTGWCWMCGNTAAVCMDHVKPLARGGSNWPSNQRPACDPCNKRKLHCWPLVEEVAA